MPSIKTVTGNHGPRLLVSLAVILVGALAIVSINDQARAARQAIPLDDYPGLGRSEAGVLRDETLAYWESFQREKLIKACMQAGGFGGIDVDVKYPDQSVIAIANSLSVKPVKRNSPGEQNDRLIASLSEADLDRFYRKLVGESASSMKAFEQGDGTVPDSAFSRDRFAQGGCVGEAAATVPGLWSLKRTLEPDLQRMRAQATSEAQDAYAQCPAAKDLGIAASDPGDLESLLSKHTPGSERAAEIRNALTHCAKAWRNAYQSAESRIAQTIEDHHSDLLGKSIKQYSGKITELSSDKEFVDHLSGHAAESMGLK